MRNDTARHAANRGGNAWRRKSGNGRPSAAPLAGTLLAAALLAPALTPGPAAAVVVRRAAPAGRASHAAASAVTVTCVSKTHPALARRLAWDIAAARRGRSDSVALVVEAPAVGVSCSLSGAAHFDSASVVKVTILGALLRKALDQHRYLTAREAALAREMITRSDNDAASALWAELGHAYLEHFLNLAGMTQTTLGPGGYWGLTQITARDETRLLHLLVVPNTVLSKASRAYARTLTAEVIPAQRWGVPAGAPAGVTVHVKNGWLPRDTHGWRIHSIGVFTSPRSWYTIVVLSQDNRTMDYGVTTIEDISRVIHRDLNPGATAVIRPSAPSPSWGTPDERLPALPGIP